MCNNIGKVDLDACYADAKLFTQLYNHFAFGDPLTGLPMRHTKIDSIVSAIAESLEDKLDEFGDDNQCTVELNDPIDPNITESDITRHTCRAMELALDSWFAEISADRKSVYFAHILSW